MTICTLDLLKAGLTADQLGHNEGGYGAMNPVPTDAQLTDLIAEAQSLLAAPLGWRIEATHVIENVQGSGSNRLWSRRYPICYTNAINLIYPGNGALQKVNVQNSNSVVSYWELGSYQNYNPFVYQAAGYLTIFPRGIPIQIDYVYGYPMTTLAADAAQGATTLHLASGFGFGNNSDYTIYDPVAGNEVITTADVGTYTAGSASLVLTTGTQVAHTAAAVLAVSNMPFEVIRVVRRIVERRLLGRNSPALTGRRSRTTGETQKLTESYVEVPELTAADLASLYALNRNVGIV